MLNILIFSDVLVKQAAVLGENDRNFCALYYTSTRLDSDAILLSVDKNRKGLHL